MWITEAMVCILCRLYTVGTPKSNSYNFLATFKYLKLT